MTATEPEPLGASLRPDATSFVVASSVAERVEVCLFDRDGAEVDRVDLERSDDHAGRWRTDIGGVGAGQRYGFRVHGPGEPRAGHACDPAKLLVDPAAREVVGELRWAPELVAPGVDSAPLVPRSVVVAPPPSPVERPPLRPAEELLVYEAHVGHLTARNPLVPLEARGRYAGLAAPATIDHLLRIGVTAVELLPVQQFVSEQDLVAAGARNVWGYNPLAWGAPHAGYASPGGDAVAELRTAVSQLHEAGIEVWLDVVYNHTCEGALGRGPILSWRGFDNAATYRLIAGEHGLVDDDVTGCGNAVDVRSPMVRELIVATLVRWVEEYGIDGFRFDLAATLIRGDDGPWEGAELLADLRDEPRLAGVRLIAEPWDVGLGGYALGRFPAPWSSWNDRFRDDVRDLWRGAPVTWSAVASRLTGSADLLGGVDGSGPLASTNAVATHDGFTVADLVAYEHPVDGGHGQRSSNSGFDGPTADEAVLAARGRRQRALLGTVLIAQGIPLLSSGDEIGRSQGGRADGYTLDPDAWGLPWPEADWDLAAWVAEAARLRLEHPVLRRARWIGPDEPGLRWRAPDGSTADDALWEDPSSPGLMVELAPVGSDDGAPVVVLLARHGEVGFELPPGSWRIALDADQPRGRPSADERLADASLTLQAPGFVVLVADR